MPQLSASKKKRAFYKQTFEVRKKGKTQYMHTLLVNPQDMSIEEPARISAQQTLGGAYVTHFGEGLHIITLSGTTGFGARYNATGSLTDGYTELKNLRDKVYRDFVKSKDTSIEMFWYNWEDEQYYKVVPNSFRLSRNQSEPTLYRYEIRMTAVAKVGAGKKPTPSKKAYQSYSTASVQTGLSSALSGASEVLYRMGGARV